MRKILFILCLSWAFANQSNAQDIIVKRNGEQVKGTVSKVNEEDIVYKPAGSQSGALVKIFKKELHKIVFPDGSEEVYNPLISSNTKPQKSSSTILDKSNTHTKTSQKNTIPQEESKSIFQEEVSNDFASQKKLFSSIGFQYRKSFLEESFNEIGLQLGIGYRLSELLAIGLTVESSFAADVPKGVGLLLVNGMAYPSLIYKLSPQIKVYGGFGMAGAYVNDANTLIEQFNTTTGYQAGVMFGLGNFGNIKVGYFNTTQQGDKGGISVVVSTPLKW